jgi:hypothetical protein
LFEASQAKLKEIKDAIDYIEEQHKGEKRKGQNLAAYQKGKVYV